MTRVIVQLEKIYPDGSGAPATVTCEGHTFAADYLAEPCLTLISKRLAPKRVIAMAYRAYTTQVTQKADAAWFALNTAMYGCARCKTRPYTTAEGFCRSCDWLKET